MKKGYLIPIIVIVGMLIASCGPAAPTAAPAAQPTAAPAQPTQAPAAKGGGTMYMITKVAGIPYFELNSKPGAEEASKELGYDFVFTAPAKPLATEQIELIEAAIAQKVKAILVSADDPDALCPSLKKARDAGIVVVAWDSDVQVGCRQLFQNQASAEEVGRGQAPVGWGTHGRPPALQKERHLRERITGARSSFR